MHRKKIGCKKLLPFDGRAVRTLYCGIAQRHRAEGSNQAPFTSNRRQSQSGNIAADSLRRQFEHRAQAIDAISSLRPLLSP